MTFNSIIVKLENIHKSYFVFGSTISRIFTYIFPKLNSRIRPVAEYKILSNINMEISQGECLGIVGENGSGKSTLLHIIAGTTKSTHGKRYVHGRISGILELGSSLNPNLSGIDNIYLSLTSYGVDPKDIPIHAEKIVEFSGLSNSIHKLVHAYSSGMKMRLAFSIIINLNCDLLIVDEVLAVGDELFQKKCYDAICKMKESGCTVIFVSHSADQILKFCDRAVLIHNGSIILDCEPKYVINKYQQLLYAPNDVKLEIVNTIKSSNHNSTSDIQPHLNDAYIDNFIPQSKEEYISLGAHIYDIKLKNLNGDPVNHIISGMSYIYEYKVKFNKQCYNVGFGMLIKRNDGFELGGAALNSSANDLIDIVFEGSDMVVSFKFDCNLNLGVYFLNAGVMGTLNSNRTYLHRVIDALCFKVIDKTNTLFTSSVNFNPYITVDHV